MDLNVKHKTQNTKLKFLEENTGENIDDLGYNDASSAETPKSQQSTRKIIDQLDLTKIKIFCSAKDNIKRMKRQATDMTFEERHKNLSSKVYRDFIK